jgi:Flp pilus assembly pilin Flp
MSVIVAQTRHWSLVDLISRAAGGEEGQDMMEYALLAAFITIALLAIIVLIGPYLKDIFQDVVNGLGSA